MGLFIQETFINATEESALGESEVYETDFETKGELFKFLQKEYGGCVSKVYINRLDGKSKEIGWVFQKNSKYEDTKQIFKREVWITVYSKEPTKTIRYHYA